MGRICDACDYAPDSSRRRNEGHVGVGLGDRMKVRIFLDGVDVTRHTVEADAVAGWVLVAELDENGHVFACPGDPRYAPRHFSQVLCRGQVSIVSRSLISSTGGN